MRPEIRERLTSEIQAEAAARYALNPSDLEAQDGFESFIYRFQQQDTGCILRIGHSERRNETLVRGELDWIGHLAANNVQVGAGVASHAGQWVETIPDGYGHQFVCAAFSEVPGRPAWKYGWSNRLYEVYGETLGRMHRFTKTYQPSDPHGYRPDWSHPAIIDTLEVLEQYDPAALLILKDLYQSCESLPTSTDAYGLIHFDVHEGNFLVDEHGRIGIFDFDDCNYSWFINDIAIVLFYKEMWAKDAPAAIRTFMPSFLKGYRRENRLDPSWLEMIPTFLKIREIDLYAVIQRDFDLETEDDPWIVGFMKDRKERIHRNLPFFEFDFNELSEYM